MKISPARAAAFEILSKIESDQAYSSILLPLYEEKLEPADRALCHEITLGVLRRQLLLDRLADTLTNGKKLDRAVRIILRIALYQLKYLDKIPAHAAINEAVNQTQKAKKTSAKSLVNAVLRKFTRERIEPQYADDAERLSVETSHPRWLIEKWSGAFGAAETARLAHANNETPALDYRFTAKTTEAVEKSLAATEKNDRRFLRELADNGKIYFQDAASQLVAAAVGLQPDESFLDVCCAPASKFSLINYLIGAPQKLFTGGDLYEQRLKTARRTCEKVGAGGYQFVAYDAEKSLPFAANSFDVVLLDAPCSGTGTLRRNPEIRYALNEKDFAELSRKQLAILKNASKLVKSGGRLIYSTCSLEPEENEEVAEKFIGANAEFEKIVPHAANHLLTADGYARTFPQRDQMDGFFIGVFAKK